MDCGYKVTTNGRALLTKCMATEKPLLLTRAAVGSGRVSDETNLADVHELISYAAEAAIGERTHENDRLYFTVQYTNSTTPELSAFSLSEFIVYAQEPETGKNIDLLYATLGDYSQPVPAYSAVLPPSVWNFPVVLVISDEIEVEVTAPSGLVTYDDLNEVVQGVGSCIIRDITIPAAGWVAHGITEDPEYAKYPYMADVAVDGCTEQHFPTTSISRVSEDAAAGAGMSANADTFDGYARFFAKRVPEADLTATIQLRSENLMTPGGGSSISTDDIATDEEANQTINNAFG